MKIATIAESYLIGLNPKEALMLLRLLHGARLHGPTALEQELGGDAEHFLRELATALLRTSGVERKPTTSV